jgi:hypothetical protein
MTDASTNAIEQSANIFDRLSSVMSKVYAPNKKNLPIGIDDLSDLDADAIGQAFGLLAGDTDVEINVEHLFNVVTDDCGLVEKILAAGLGLGKDGQPAVVSGGNEFPATCTPAGVVVGDVTFSIIVDSETKTTTLGDVEYEFYPAKAESFVVINGESVSLEIPVLVNSREPHTKPMLASALKSNELAVKFLRAPMSFGNTYNAAELGLGTFPLVGMKFIMCNGKNGKYPRAIGILSTGDQVWMDGTLETQVLRRRWQPVNGREALAVRTDDGWKLKDRSRPVYLNILGLEEYESRTDKSIRTKVKGNISENPLPNFDGFSMLPDQKQPVAATKAIASASVESAPVSVEAITAVVPEVVEQSLPF